MRRNPIARGVIAAAASTILCALAAHADSYDDLGLSSFKLYFSIGWTQLNVDPLNDVLAPKGYGRFGGDALSLGGALHAQFGRFVIGGQGHGLLLPSREATLQGRLFGTDLQAGAGFFDLGAAVFQTERFNFTPLVGIGGGASVVSAVDRSAATFDAVATDPRVQANLVRAAFLLDFSAKADFAVPLGRGRRDHGLVVGARAGYVVAPIEAEWHYEDRPISGGPEGALKGPYIRFLIGSGSWR